MRVVTYILLILAIVSGNLGGLYLYNGLEGYATSHLTVQTEKLSPLTDEGGDGLFRIQPVRTFFNRPVGYELYLMGTPWTYRQGPPATGWYVGVAEIITHKQGRTDTALLGYEKGSMQQGSLTVFSVVCTDPGLESSEVLERITQGNWVSLPPDRPWPGTISLACE